MKAFSDAIQHAKLAISKTRNTGTTEHGTPEQHHSGTRNTGTLKILNLLKIRKNNTGGCESIAAIIIA
jgi:hypothetical protein